jgi:hypothetical protein
MSAPLQLKDFPPQLKSLIKREAEVNRRTLTQEAIILLEEAIAQRASRPNPREAILEILTHYDNLPTKDSRSMEHIVEYDELGVPK